ncbi:aminoglycoside phosphotransferase family protein [Verrucomicrobiaceae bacterium R5-34]|uniref:Aminoglycoside phosphotransferase family protein n=1 Tax=Oceaniferula flava TaxID=2800421 RepID=A0AAE2SHG7_9BACT|nr:aminoglycoside phosphotransferase family protein [Oceaniferula flavus]MBK1829749.1 aminoglycoside phosphotransferase family protein [Verrucomicrobiaceae bacterium R5-34]MBK1856446.1 aminoglycoside phosphotransferase family protein [Oceaniferula flavus]MBM1137753.1 aminoglycoside phosphotransferase family protein [Oceaniferula flavus]
MIENDSHIEEIANEFAIAGEFLTGEEVDSGHINSTYMASFKKSDGRIGRYIFQRINENVFKDPLAVMRNVEMVTRHINWKVMRVKKDIGGQTLNLYPARGGRFYATGEGGGIWRCYNFIEGCRTYDIVENTRQAYQAAHAFGSFQDLVSDIPVEDIKETIPDFHNTPKRYARLMEVIAQDTHGRVAGAQEEINFIKSRENIVSKLLDLKDAGVLPERITHNDTKINNVMIDIETDEAVCVIDLDTVMPGLSLYDFGDMVRTAVSPAAEDEQDLSKVEMRMPMFEALAEGYMDSCDCLCKAEIENLAFAGKLISLETGIRFLTDHLEGDVYFKTHRDQHNLDRARTQLKLVEKLEEQKEKMEAFVKRLSNARSFHS